jgi:hypothetical protein
MVDHVSYSYQLFILDDYKNYYSIDFKEYYKITNVKVKLTLLIFYPLFYRD